MYGESQWNKTAKGFHWIVALLIAVAATLGWTADLAAISTATINS
jgi:cytochrome b561